MNVNKDYVVDDTCAFVFKSLVNFKTTFDVYRLSLPWNSASLSK